MKNFKRLFLSYELSLELKNIGYKDDTLYYWFPNPNLKLKNDYFGLLHREYYVGKDNLPLYAMVADGIYTNTISAPTYQETIDWLREHFRIRVDIQSKTSRKTGYNLWMWDSERVCWIHVYFKRDEKNNTDSIQQGSTFLSMMDYYETCEQAVIESIKIAKLILEGSKIVE